MRREDGLGASRFDCDAMQRSTVPSTCRARRWRHEEYAPRVSAETPVGVSFRPVREEDRVFLRRLYASTRDEELAQVTDWSAEQKEAFLTQQFEAQHHHYQWYYPEASFELILDHGDPIGRLYVWRSAREIRLVDLALLPEARGRGIGTALLGDLLAEAERTDKTVSIHVEHFNPALRLYRRLGFRQVDENGPYVRMEWRPPRVR
jgi:ribosomal protein S18 acetylase RimI-like enzyme